MAIKNVFKDTSALKEKIKNLSVDDVQAMQSAIEADEVLLVDLREIQELIDLGTIPGAKHVARGMLEFWADPSSPYYREYFQEEKPIVVFVPVVGVLSTRQWRWKIWALRMSLILRLDLTVGRRPGETLKMSHQRANGCVSQLNKESMGLVERL